MPELPEVETVCRGLRNSIIGTRIKKILLRRADIRSEIPADLPERVQNTIITDIRRRAKYILIHLDNGESLIVHLGMSGKLLVLSSHPALFDKHDHVIFFLSGSQSVLYHDPRRFGLVTIEKTDSLPHHPLLAHLGPEPLAESFTGDMLYQSLRKRKQAIKPALMDQQTVVGVGNIYASEALFRARIHPARPANEISREEAVRLTEHIKQVLADAIDSGGSTLRNYVDSRGENGYFQHHFDVYGKDGAPCPVCTASIQRMAQAGRSTFFCRICQK